MHKLIATTLLSAAAGAAASTSDQSPQAHSPQHQAAGSMSHQISEGGQAAFSAVQEIVAALEQDPSTDWSKVSIDRLHHHLLDMDAVFTRSTVRTERLADGARFVIAGKGADKDAIQRLVPAHAGAMKNDRWTYSTKLTDDGAVLEVKGRHQQDTAKIRALGFYGLVARGSHHQPHHFGMAAGTGAHR